uniref:SAM domain-containing protein n=1 Tax=Ditylenchus dipsaci TaxID=166011 RepID=A0A915DIB1_9BILA
MHIENVKVIHLTNSYKCYSPVVSIASSILYRDYPKRVFATSICDYNFLHGSGSSSSQTLSFVAGQRIWIVEQDSIAPSQHQSTNPSCQSPSIAYWKGIVFEKKTGQSTTGYFPSHLVHNIEYCDRVESMAHVRRQNGYRGVQLSSATAPGQEVVSRSCKKVAMPKVPDMHQPRSSTSNSCHIYSGHRLSTASVGNELFNGSSREVCSPTFTSNYSTMGKVSPAGDTFGTRAFKPLLENTTTRPSGRRKHTGSEWAQQPRALEEQGIARPSIRHTPQANTLPTDMGVDRQDSFSVKGAMDLHSVINNLRIEDHQSTIHNSFPLMHTSHAGNRNSTGSNSSQTSSGFESGKTGSSTGGDLSNLVNSNSSSSCTSSNLVTAVNLMDSPSSRVSSSGSTTSAGGLGCSSAGSSNIISPEIANLTSKQPKISSKATSSCGRVNIREMMAKGIPESEIMAEWLQRLCLSQCLALFISQGYDLLSISRITPEDLTTLGISKPADRKRLMQDIQQWNIVDNWPAHVTDDSGIRDWLICIGLKQYIDLFETQGYTTMHELQKVTWEDLEDIGISKLGHMKRICLALKKLKLSRSGSLREQVSSLTDCGDYGTLQPHHFRQVPIPCSPSTSCSTTASSTLQPNCSSASDSGYGTTSQLPSNCYDNTGFMSPFMALDRRHFQQPSQNQQQKSSSLIDAKQRPVVTVRPNKQPLNSSLDQDLDDGSVIYKNSCFGLPKLNLYRTSQILSDFSELPKSIDGEPMSEVYQRYSSYSSHDCPPPPAPMPSTAASKKSARPEKYHVNSALNYGSPALTYTPSSQQQQQKLVSPRNISLPKMEPAEQGIGGGTFIELNFTGSNPTNWISTRKKVRKREPQTSQTIADLQLVSHNAAYLQEIKQLQTYNQELEHQLNSQMDMITELKKIFIVLKGGSISNTTQCQSSVDSIG